jgi:hypothetical protein
MLDNNIVPSILKASFFTEEFSSSAEKIRVSLKDLGKNS